MRFSRQNRVHLATDFQFIKNKSEKADCSAFIFYALPRPERSYSRVAVVASKRIGNAVVRNLARRRFRAIFRENSPQFKTAADVLIFVRSGFYRFEYAKLSRKFSDAAERIIK